MKNCSTKNGFNHETVMFVSHQMLTFLHVFTAKHRSFPAFLQLRESGLSHLQLVVVHQNWVYYDQKSPQRDWPHWFLGKCFLCFFPSAFKICHGVT
jgi:hypothetical protein